jgi:hypothetical protein
MKTLKTFIDFVLDPDFSDNINEKMHRESQKEYEKAIKEYEKSIMEMRLMEAAKKVMSEVNKYEK